MKYFILVGIFLCLIVSAQSTYSQIKKEVHFRMGQGTAVTYAAGQETLSSLNNDQQVLQREGEPVFFADSPEGKEGGSILFNTDNGYYYARDRWFEPTEHFVLEVWAKARRPERKDLDAKHMFGVVSIGDGKHGYNIVQQGDKWFALVGGVGMYEIGMVTYNRWTHLAMLADGEEFTLWMNGEQQGTFQKTVELNPGFAVGNLSKGNNQFLGDIYEVRYATVEKDAFDPLKHFLLNYAQVKAQKQYLAEKQKERVERVARPGYRRVLKDDYRQKPVEKDYLIEKVDRPSRLYLTKAEDGMSARMTLTNGLISRTFYLSENLACISYKNLTNDAQYLRAVKPEARIKIDGRWIEVGGLNGQPEKSYLLKEWLPEMKTNPNAWVLSGISTEKPEARYPWKRKFNARQAEWPPEGLHLVMHFEPPQTEKDLKDVTVDIHYQVYDGIPVMSKWLTLDNQSGKDIVIDETECEVLAVNQDQVGRLHVESNYSFALVNGDPKGSALMHYKGEPKKYHAGRTTTRWEVDPEYNTWATHNQAEDRFLDYPHHNLLKSSLPMGPWDRIPSGESFESFITFELLIDSDDRERNSLAHRRMYRKLAPQITESLLSASITSHDTKELKKMIDQMAELGFERLGIDPGPGIDHSNLDPEYVAHWKEIAEYARKRGIIMGGYELVIASRGRGADINCIDPETRKPGSLFGQSVCIASKWKDQYFPKMFKFFEKTGFKSWNADGPYHGDACAATDHKHHRGLKDSQWEQWKVQVDMLHELQSRNCYLPIPDWYFLNGQCATGMGYREASANLSPEQQRLLGRQYIYDGTWYKIPTMGWMTLQLVGFYTNDPRVGLEPLKDNLDRYERGLVQYLGSGCQLTVRGNRLYDTPKTKAMVKKWTDWFLKYREVLTSDMIHLGRPTGRDLDFMMHVNPYGEHKGLVLVFNPTGRKISKQVTLPLYYTGLSEEATISEKGKDPEEYRLDREYNVKVDVTVEANGFTWLLIE